MNRSKKYILGMISALSFLLLLTGVFVYMIDPFYHYHKPWFGMEPYLEEAVYQTAGAANNFDYDSAIIGSSMVENFSVDKFNTQFGWDTVKLAYSAALMDDYNAIFQEVFESHKVKNVVFPIDNYTMIAKSTDSYVPRPEFLYDDTLLNDVNYLFNYDVIRRSAILVQRKLTGTEPDYNSSYFWNRNDFSTATVIYGYLYERSMAAWNDVEKDFLVENALENISVIGEFITKYPDTTFYIYFPPYNVMFWDYKILMGHKDATIYMNQKIMEYLLSFDNVKLYYFMNDESLVTNLDYYIDRGHYSPKINDYIMESMAEGKFLVTKENYTQIPEQMEKILNSYDFETVINSWSPNKK